MQRTVLVALAIVFFSASAAPAAQDALASIRQLYGSAEYEQALSAINRLRVEGVSGIEVDRYKVLCLVALGRADEAKRAVESIVSADPLFAPEAAEASPRVRAVYSEVRRKLLPALGREMYAEAKAAFDRKDFAAAREKFERILRLVDDPDSAGDNAFADLRVIVTGFLDLTKASAPPPPPDVAPVPENEAPAAPVIVEPVAIKQDIPAWSGRLGVGPNIQFRGTIEVAIDPRGDVVGVTLIDSIHPIYDSRLLRSAREWKYEPARRDGAPVSSSKRVDIVLRDEQQ
jgi:hypothetical protein